MAPSVPELDALLAACADEPIHVPEAVQPFGTALVVDRGGVVRVRSGDPADLLGGRAGLGGPVAEALGARAADRILGGESLLEVVGPDGRELDVVVHQLPDGLRLLELEPIDDAAPVADELIARQRPLWSARSLDHLLRALVVEVRALTGFDRVMAYRFDEEWNGEVVAEAVDDALDPFLGLRFPASDIPAQARDLYRRNPARLIADVGYVPSPLVHEDPAATAPLDLSPSGLRSVSPVHLEYLRNMGVAASMSLSLLVDGELWGLVACHHVRGPRRPDPRRRRAATALAELASALVVTVAEAEVLADRVVVSDRVGALRARVEAAADPMDALLADPGLLTLVDAVGAVVCVDGRLGRAGETPPVAEATVDAVTLLERPGSGAVSTDALADPSEGLVGALVAPLGAGGRSWVLWYRPELVREVRWAGDPRSDELVAEPGARPRLGPRRSFEAFVESVHGRCRPWTAGDRWAADELGVQCGAVLARRTHERLASAAVVQRAMLLDTDVSPPGFDVAVRYQAADDDPIGGDWHDVVPLPDGTTAFVVGDAAGHGVEVAGTMAQLRNALRAYLVAGLPPAGALGRLDDLVRQLLPGQLATAVVCVVDPEAGRVVTASAGHLPPFRVGPSGATALTVPAMPAFGLGTGDGRSPGPGIGVALEPGDGLVLFSDGLVERRGTPVPMMLDRLAGALAQAGLGGGAGPLCDAAIASLAPDGTDDVTVLACLWSGSGKG